MFFQRGTPLVNLEKEINALANAAIAANTTATVLSGSASLNFGSVVANTCADLTITVTGAALNDAVALGMPNAAVPSNGSYSAWVSAADTVKVRYCNNTVGAIDPVVGTFKVKIFK